MNLDIRNTDESPGYFPGEAEPIANFISTHRDKVKHAKPGESGLFSNAWASNPKKKRRGQTLEEMRIAE